EGIPLYAVETVRALIDRDAVVPKEGRYVLAPDASDRIDFADLTLPTSLHTLIASRLDGLPPDQRAVVQDAAVLGLSFTVGGLASSWTWPLSRRGCSGHRSRHAGTWRWRSIWSLTHRRWHGSRSSPRVPRSVPAPRRTAPPWRCAPKRRTGRPADPSKLLARLPCGASRSSFSARAARCSNRFQPPTNNC